MRAYCKAESNQEAAVSKNSEIFERTVCYLSSMANRSLLAPGIALLCPYETVDL